MLFKQLVGTVVLNVENCTAPGRTVRVYAFCTRVGGPIPYSAGAITLVAININSTPVTFSPNVNGVVNYVRDEYHLTSPNNQMASQYIALNGKVLQLGEGGSLPSFDPISVSSNTPITMAGLSYGFFVLTHANGAACH